MDVQSLRVSFNKTDPPTPQPYTDDLATLFHQRLFLAQADTLLQAATSLGLLLEKGEARRPAADAGAVDALMPLLVSPPSRLQFIVACALRSLRFARPDSDVEAKKFKFREGGGLGRVIDEETTRDVDGDDKESLKVRHMLVHPLPVGAIDQFTLCCFALHIAKMQTGKQRSWSTTGGRAQRCSLLRYGVCVRWVAFDVIFKGLFR